MEASTRLEKLIVDGSTAHKLLSTLASSGVNAAAASAGTPCSYNGINRPGLGDKRGTLLQSISM